MNPGLEAIAPEENLVGSPKKPQIWMSALSGLAITFLAWPISNVLPSAGLDPSWAAGLHIAATKGLLFGKTITFTYGPLGFLSAPALYSTRTGVAAFAYSFAVYALFTILIIHVVRASLPFLVACGIAYGALLLATFEPSELMAVVVFLVCVAAMTRPSNERTALLLGSIGGAVAALQILIKFNTGIAAVVLVAIAVWAISANRIRDEIVLMGSFAGTMMVLWIATEGSFGTLLPFFRQSLQLAAGYSKAMATESPGRGTEYAAIVVFLAGLVALLMLRGMKPDRLKISTGLLLLFMTYFEFLHSFVRHDPIHSLSFLVFFSLIPFAFRWEPRHRIILGEFSILALAMTAVFWTGFQSLSHQIVSRPTAVFRQLGTLFDASQRSHDVAVTRRLIRNQLGIDSATLALLRGTRVSIDPIETSVIWAYDLDWAPVPIFQTYAAYTTALDQLNGNALLNSGPSRILRAGPLQAIDARYPLFESPNYQLGLLCNFKEIHATSRWQVLARIVNRCGVPRRLGVFEEAPGDVMILPKQAKDELLYATVEMRESLAAKLLARLWKPIHEPSVVMDDVPYRFLPGTATGPLMLCIPTFVESAEYGGGICPSRFHIDGIGAYRVSLFTIPLHP